MDSRITSGFSLLPEWMPVLNAILIMAFIPIFQAIYHFSKIFKSYFQLVLYPLCEKLGIKPT
jgi:dipeptide/tripeptide permease